jgi:hypothetical protein
VDQAIPARPIKRKVLDKRRSLQNASGNLLDIHRDGESVRRGVTGVSGAAPAASSLMSEVAVS